MKLFGQLIRTAVNVVTLPVAVARDVFTLGGVATEQDTPYTVQALHRLKDDANEDSDDEDD